MPEGELAGSRSKRFFRRGEESARSRAAEEGFAPPETRCAPRQLRLGVDLELGIIGETLEGVHHLLERLGHLRAICCHEPRATTRCCHARVAKRARFPRLLSREPTKASDLSPIRLLLVRGDRLVRIPLVRSRCRSARQRCGIGSARYVRKQLRRGRAAVSKCAPPGNFSRNHHPTAA
jgi:hypothetical protein